MTQGMTCFVTGATGAVGRPAVRRLLEAGHQVRGVARDDEKAAALRAAGAEPVVVDLFDRDGLVDAVDGVEAIVHLATNVPPLAKMGFLPAWKTHNRLRTETTRHLLDAAHAHGIRRFVKESITFIVPGPRRRVDRRVRRPRGVGEGARPDARRRASGPRAQRRQRRRCRAQVRALLRLRQPRYRRGAQDGSPCPHGARRRRTRRLHVVDPRGRRRGRGRGRARRARWCLQRRRRRAAHRDVRTSTRSPRPSTSHTFASRLLPCCGPWAGRTRGIWSHPNGSRTVDSTATTGWAPVYRSAREGWVATAEARDSTS